MATDNIGPVMEEHAADGPLLSSTFYNYLKWTTLVLLPSVSAAYFALALLLDLPAGEEVVGVIAIVCTLFGSVLGLSTHQYNASDAKFDGAVILSPGDDEDSTNLRFMMDPAALAGKNKVLVKVDKSQLPSV